MQAVTRRQFLASLLPFSISAKRVALAVKMASICGVVVLTFSLLKSIGLGSSLRLAGAAIVVFVVFCCLGLSIVWVQSVLRRLPTTVAAAVTTLFELLSILLPMVYGVYLYRRWESGHDLTGTAIALGAYYVMRFISRCDRRANQALEPTPIAVTPRANARVAPATGVAHL
jgi:hypothetical protein